MAVPRDWPRSSVRVEGWESVCRTKWVRAMPSVRRPDSVGVPVERPKPR